LIFLSSPLDGNGAFEFAAQLQQRELRLITIMLASSGMRGDAARCRELGIAAYLTEPIAPAELLQAIRLCLQSASRNGSAQAAPLTRYQLAPELKPARILLAEDNPVNQKVAVRVLERHGHHVEVAEDGAAAVEAAKRGIFDLILMDLQMPNMDGFEAVAHIRKFEGGSGRHIPIVAMTAHVLSGDRERCLQAGMDAYLPKPVRPGQLLETIEPLLRNSAAPIKSSAEQAGADAKLLRQINSEDPALLREMAEAFRNAAPVLLGKLERAVAAKDADAIRTSAHALRGMLANFGANGATEVAQQLENDAESSRIDGARDLAHKLARGVTLLKTQLAEFTQAVPPGQSG
jgi:CheY-like chemotaxis protein